MEIKNMFLGDEDELDLLLKGWLVDNEGCEREFAVRIAEQEILEFDDEGLGRAQNFACRDFIDTALFGEDRLGIFKAIADAAEAIKKNIGKNPVLGESRIPAEIREKILIAGEYYEKARTAEGEVRNWLRQENLITDKEETRIEEMFIETVRMGDGGGASGFIEDLELILGETKR